MSHFEKVMVEYDCLEVISLLNDITIVDLIQVFYLIKDMNV